MWTERKLSLAAATYGRRFTLATECLALTSAAPPHET